MNVTAALPKLSKKTIIVIACAVVFACALLFCTGCKKEGSSDANINLTTYSNESLGFSVQYNGDFPLNPDNDGFPVESISSSKSEDAKGTIKMMYITTGISAEDWVNQQCKLAIAGNYGPLQEGTDPNTIVASQMKFDGHDAYAANFVTMENGDDYLGQYLIADNVEGGIFAYEVTFNPNGFEATSVELERVMTYIKPDPHFYDKK